jgi:hypothetical protein
MMIIILEWEKRRMREILPLREVWKRHLNQRE